MTQNTTTKILNLWAFVCLIGTASSPLIPKNRIKWTISFASSGAISRVAARKLIDPEP